MRRGSGGKKKKTVTADATAKTTIAATCTNHRHTSKSFTCSSPSVGLLLIALIIHHHFFLFFLSIACGKEGEECRNNSTFSVSQICLCYHLCVMRGEVTSAIQSIPFSHELEVNLPRSSSKVEQEIAIGAY
jgi:hypothetical protein